MRNVLQPPETQTTFHWSYNNHSSNLYVQCEKRVEIYLVWNPGDDFYSNHPSPPSYLGLGFRDSLVNRKISNKNNGEENRIRHQFGGRAITKPRKKESESQNRKRNGRLRAHQQDPRMLMNRIRNCIYWTENQNEFINYPGLFIFVSIVHANIQYTIKKRREEMCVCVRILCVHFVWWPFTHNEPNKQWNKIKWSSKFKTLFDFLDSISQSFSLSFSYWIMVKSGSCI